MKKVVQAYFNITLTHLFFFVIPLTLLFEKMSNSPNYIGRVPVNIGHLIVYDSVVYKKEIYLYILFVHIKI